jgi:hypothetical protein
MAIELHASATAAVLVLNAKFIKFSKSCVGLQGPWSIIYKREPRCGIEVYGFDESLYMHKGMNSYVNRISGRVSVFLPHGESDPAKNERSSNLA